MKYRGKHAAGKHERRRPERYQRAGAGCLPAGVLVARLVAERGARGAAAVNELGTVVLSRAALVRPYAAVTA